MTGSDFIIIYLFILFICNVDLDEGRLAVAKKLGANMTFKITSRDGKEVAQMINKEFGDVDKTIECTGADSSIHTAIYVRMKSFLEIFNVIALLQSNFTYLLVFEIA